MNLRRLKLRARAVFAPRRVERELDDELAFHIERETQKHIANGIGAAEARRRAIARFGSLTVAADECRDARGTALIDSVVRDVRYACRSFRRAPLAALTIVTTVGLGLGLVAVIFTILNALVFRVDEVRNPQELFALERQRSANAEPERFTRPQYDALVRDTAVFSDAFAMGPEVDSWIDGRKMEGALVTGNFFTVLGVSAARGRTLTPSDDEVGGRQTIVLSHRAWSRHFASDPGVLSRAVLVNGVPFQVVGVMPEGFRGLTVAAPDFWAPLSLLGQFRRAHEGRQDAVALQIVGRLKPGLSRGQALAALHVWDSLRAAERSAARPAAILVLEPRQGTVPLSVDALLVFMPLFFAFGLILMIGWANVANLLLARAVARQREIGIRLATGASRRRIIGQLLTESLLLALVSAALGFALSRLVLGVTVYAVTATFPPDMGDIRLAVPPADWRVALFLVAGALVSTLFFALAPALQATRVELVRAIRGEVVRDARPGRARNTLVALQVSGSVLLLTCSAVFLRSGVAAATVDPGIRTADTVTVDIVNEQMRPVMLEAVRREPSVASVVAASWPGLLGGRAAFADASPPAGGFADNPSPKGAIGKSAVTYQFVSPEYFSVLDIDVVRGRGFAAAERSASAAVAVVSESVARQLWPGRDAVGQVLRLEPDPSRDPREADEPPLLSRTLVIVGIVRDVAGFRFAGARAAGTGVYVPISAEAAKTSLTMRVHGDPERARRALIDRLTAIDPTLSQVTTLRTVAGMEAYFLGIGFWLTLVLGVLALLVTLSGLFSVLSYLVEQRTREIGVRMALGATRRSIGALVLSQSARPVGIGLLLGGSLTATLGAALLATPAAESIGSIVRL
ncbi:MAG TPA: ABC transporter permease, partial [Vicinamibacterales bacterium]|nr:ABC transporter permease [Vicinamibacterales bacterium]